MVLLREGRGEIGKERQREGETERERERVGGGRESYIQEKKKRFHFSWLAWEWSEVRARTSGR